MPTYAEIMALDPIEDENDFAVGQVVEIAPGVRTVLPYYAIIKFIDLSVTNIGEIKMQTWVPGKHQRDMLKGGMLGQGFDYYVRRMTIIGSEGVHRDLLLNQDWPSIDPDGEP